MSFVGIFSSIKSKCSVFRYFQCGMATLHPFDNMAVFHRVKIGQNRKGGFQFIRYQMKYFYDYH